MIATQENGPLNLNFKTNFDVEHEHVCTNYHDLEQVIILKQVTCHSHGLDVE